MSKNEALSVSYSIVKDRPTIKVRKLLSKTPKEILNGLKTNANLEFEDGVVKFFGANEIILIRYLLELQTLVPDMSITSNYDISKYYNNGIYVSKTINSCFENVLEDIVNQVVRPSGDRTLMAPIYEKMLNIVEAIFNEVVYSKLEYSTTLHILHFLEIQMNEKLLESLKVVHNDKSLESINKSYDTLDHVIRNETPLNNIIARSYISGTVNPNQVKQMLAARGFVTEIDSSIFKYPIASSYVLGLSNIYDLAIESRSGAKALFLSTKAIQDSEYFARELQLVAMYVENLVDGDCGNREYMDWKVRDASETGKSDIKNLIGKRFLNEKGEEEIITKKHTHLEGTTIKLRVANKCKHICKDTICTSCFGELSFNVHEHSNIGHLSSTTKTQKISQSILSTKHLTTSATSASIILDETTKKFFSIKNKDGYALRATVLNKAKSKLTITIDQKEASGLKDLRSNTDVYKLNPSWVSKISSFTLSVVYDSGEVEHYPVIVKNGSRRGSFTYEFLKYITENGVTLDDNNKYVIDLKNYTSTNPILTLPQVEFNFLELAKAIKGKFKYIQSIKGEKSLETPESLLQILFDLVNSKLDINIALLEVMVYAFSIMSLEKQNFDMGRNTDDVQLAKIGDVLSNRSIGGAYAWETVANMILSPKSFDGRNNVDHVLDGLLKPAETMKDYYGV